MTMFGSQWLANAGASYEIDQSIRFNDDDSAYLEWSSYSGSPTSGTDCTFSFWVKRCRLGATQVCIYGGDASGSTYEMIRFDSDDQFRVAQASSAYDLTTTQVFRDVSAWSHFVVAFDTDNGTAADRIKMYHNGSRITDFSVQTNPSSGYVTNFNTGGSGEAIQIGREGGNSQFLDGYMAEIVFIDGQALTPASFGETNDDGVWIPKKYSGAYGTNGYYLKGQDRSALGDDTSGNGNDFTSSGLAAADQMSDSPTKNWCTYNLLRTRGTNTLSNGNLQAAAGSAGAYVTSTFGVSSGKWYWEYTFTGTYNFPIVGIMGTALYQDAYPSQLTNAVLYYSSNGNKYIDSTGSSYGASYAVSDKIGVALNLDDNEITFFKNNSTQGAISISNREYTPLVGEEGSSNGGIIANFGQSDFEYTPPTGFKALNTSNLPAPTIKDGSAYFQPKIYTGSTSAQDITFSGNSDLPPDWLWFKARSASDHFVFDRLRGVLKTISTNDKTAEVTSTGSMTAFGADGFSLGDGGSDNDINGVDGTNYVVWGWAANGSGSSNEDGSINTTATSANTTAGFSISTFTGTGSGATVGHGLGAKPSVVLVKCFGTASTHWIINDWSGDYSNKLKLNENEAASSSSGFVTAASSTTFTLGTDTDVNGSSRTYVAYCFAEIPGYSKISSYTGNNNADGPFVFTDFAPAYVLWKNRTTAGNHWIVADRARSPQNVSVERLFPDLTNAESTSTAMCDFLSNGFKIRSTMGEINTSGDTIIYMAFAENPFGGSGLSPATAR